MLTAGPLTVKHVEEGREGITQAISVEFEQRPEGSHVEGQKTPCYGELTAFGVPNSISGGTSNRYASGTVYVMNEAGATVGKYRLTDG